MVFTKYTITNGKWMKNRVKRKTKPKEKNKQNRTENEEKEERERASDLQWQDGSSIESNSSEFSSETIEDSSSLDEGTSSSNSSRSSRIRSESKEEIYYGDEPVSPLFILSDEGYVEDKENHHEQKANHDPFPNMETGLLYLWAHTHPRISKRKLQVLLDVLLTPGFSLQNVPKTAYYLQKYATALPTLNISEHL